MDPLAVLRQAIEADEPHLKRIEKGAALAHIAGRRKAWEEAGGITRDFPLAKLEATLNQADEGEEESPSAESEPKEPPVSGAGTPPREAEPEKPAGKSRGKGRQG